MAPQTFTAKGCGRWSAPWPEGAIAREPVGGCRGALRVDGGADTGMSGCTVRVPAEMGTTFDYGQR